MILRDRRSTSHDLASLSRGGALPMRDGMEKSQKHWHEGVSSALNFPCLKEVSQNCFVFDVVKLKN